MAVPNGPQVLFFLRGVQSGKMDFKILLFSSFCALNLVWQTHTFDSQMPLTEKIFKRHTIKIKSPVRNLLIFKNHSHRTHFMIVPVIMQVIIEIVYLICVVYSFWGNNFERILYIWGAIAWIWIVLVFGFGGYYMYQSYKFKRQLPKNKNKTFWQYIRSKDK
ncbi:MAG: hypothetical protein ACI4PP_03915 [Clostridia bacterium]